MSAPTTRRSSVSIITAAFVSLLLASQAVAATWSQPIALTGSGNAATGVSSLATLGTSHAIAAYSNNGRIVVRRSTDSGATWLSPLRLSDNVQDGPAIAGKGTSVDVVWTKNDRVRYARSTNSGASFRAPVALSPKNKLVQGPTVARGANGLVVVAWKQVNSLKDIGGDAPWNIHARVSKNGGASFGPVKILGQGWQVVAAAGKGVAYVAFDGFRSPICCDNEPVIQVHRTLDGGASWKAPAHFSMGIALRGMWGMSITAAGKKAYVTYTDTIDDDGATPLWIRYRRTADKGNTWSAARNLTSPTGPDTFGSRISLKGGVVRAIFNRGSDGLWYRQSSDGVNWTADEQVAARGSAAGIGHATKIIILYSNRSNVFARTGTH